MTAFKVVFLGGGLFRGRVHTPLSNICMDKNFRFLSWPLKSAIYTPKGNDEHPFNMGVLLSLPRSGTHTSAPLERPWFARLAASFLSICVRVNHK